MLWPCLLLYGSDLRVCDCHVLTVAAPSDWPHPRVGTLFSSLDMETETPRGAATVTGTQGWQSHNSNPGLTAAHWHLSTPFSLAPNLSPPARCQWLYQRLPGPGLSAGPRLASVGARVSLSTPICPLPDPNTLSPRPGGIFRFYLCPEPSLLAPPNEPL